jgi:rfaE bifunctional protein kinase chain/domain
MRGQAGEGSLPSARVAALLDGMRGRRLVVVGDVMLDRYLIGDTERISPEAPVPVVTIHERRLAPGGAANVAANAAALGAVVTLVGIVGEDLHAEALREAVVQAGMSDDGLVAHRERPTTAKTRLFARGQQVVRIDEEETAFLDDATMERLSAAALGAIAEADALLLEDYDKGVLTPALISALIGAARTRGIPVVADPKHRGFFEYRGATVFKPNRREFAHAFPRLEPDSAADLGQALALLAVDHLLVTRGTDGMVLASSGIEQPHRIASRAREVFDVSGAGDTVTAWVGAALAAGASVVEAAELANLAAGVEVGKAGVAVVTPAEVRAAAGLPQHTPIV